MPKHLSETVREFAQFAMLALLAVASLWISISAFADETTALPAGTTTTALAGAPQQPGLFGMAIPFLAMFGIVYFLMIRPQQKKMKEQQSMLESLKHGDEILTSSGILGTITGITEKVVTVEVADDVRVKMMKSQIAQVIKGSVKDLA